MYIEQNKEKDKLFGADYFKWRSSLSSQTNRREGTSCSNGVSFDNIHGDYMTSADGDLFVPTKMNFDNDYQRGKF